MDVLSLSPFRAGSVLWRPRPDRWTLTVVCKGTFALAPGESSLAAEQEGLHEHDRHREDDPRRSVYAPSDLAPFKPRADVMLVGHAFAPRSEMVRSLEVRMIVGDVEKAVEVFCPRVWTREGELREGQRWTTMPLRYELAAGGLDTWNPVGVSPSAAPDQYGQRLLPNLQPPGVRVAQWTDLIAPTGFGPIGSTWLLRREKLGRRADAWSDVGWTQIPLDDDFDGEFFQAAPSDQQVDALREGERVILEYLHPDHPRLTTNLAGVHPHAFVEIPGSPVRDLVMTADTLWIDTDRAICTVTWRGQIAVDGPGQQGRVVIAAEEPGQRVKWSAIAGAAALGRATELPAAPAPPESEADAAVMARMTLPFVQPEDLPPQTARPARPTGPRQTIQMAPPEQTMPSWVAAPRPPAIVIPSLSPGAEVTMISAAPVAIAARAEAALEVAARPPLDSTSLREARARAAVAYEVIWFEPSVAALVRGTSAWASLLAPEADAGPGDVAAVLSRGAPSDADLEGALFASAGEGHTLTPPLVLLAGELELPLDEIEALRMMVGAAASLAPGDRSLGEVLDFVRGILETPLHGSPEVIDGLRARVREAWAKANHALPANHLDLHAERVLLEQRRYQRRELLDDTWIRALLSPSGGGARVPAYLPARLSRRLPLFTTFPARVLAEVLPQQDQYEQSPVALRVVALARVVLPRGRRA